MTKQKRTMLEQTLFNLTHEERNTDQMTDEDLQKAITYFLEVEYELQRNHVGTCAV